MPATVETSTAKSSEAEVFSTVVANFSVEERAHQMVDMGIKPNDAKAATKSAKQLKNQEGVKTAEVVASKAE